MTERQEKAKAYETNAQEQEKLGTKIKRRQEKIADIVFGMGSSVPGLDNLEKLREEQAEDMLKLEGLQAEGFLMREELLHLIRGQKAGKKFGF